MDNSPGLILIHEWWGLNDQIKATAKRFAKLGYAVLAVDLYDGRSANKPNQAREYATDVRQKMKKAFSNLEAALQFLKDKNGVDKTRLASIGWCFGGGWSLEMAKSNLGLKASVIYYGRFNPKDDLMKMKTKIMGHFGAKDRVLLIDNVKSWKALLNNSGKKHKIYIYPNSGNAFFNENSKSYNRDDAELSWQRTVNFLKNSL